MNKKRGSENLYRTNGRLLDADKKDVISDMSSAVKYIPHYTYDDWLYWEGRWELIDGIPIAMSPMPLPEHQRVAANILTELVLSLRKNNCKNCKAYQPIDYKISEDTIVEPDILVVCGKIYKNFLDFAPPLVVEVLSKSTEERDRGVKYDCYEQQGVKYYMIVDWRIKTIEIYELINGKYQLQCKEKTFEFHLHEDCSISPELENVWE